MARVHVALGSNVEPARWLAVAARALRGHFPDARFSSAYRNPAFGFEGADFINAVAGFETALSAPEVITCCHEVEALCGRRRDDAKWAPRVMDVDLLLHGDSVVEADTYRLPRPDLLKRVYMLAPLAELAPQLRHPLTGRTILDHWHELERTPHTLERLALDLNA